jgi:hypothetical protein
MPVTSEPEPRRNEFRTFAQAVAELTADSDRAAAEAVDLTPGSERLWVKYDVNPGTIRRFQRTARALQAVRGEASPATCSQTPVFALAEEALGAAASYYEQTGRPFPALAAACRSRRTTVTAPTATRAFMITPQIEARIAAVADRNSTVPSGLAEEALTASATHYENQFNDGQEFTMPGITARPLSNGL